jgi:hypothetical protein
MKYLASLLVAVGITMGVAAAQDLSGNANNSVAGLPRGGADVTGFRSSVYAAPTRNGKEIVNPHPDLRPRMGGVWVDAGKDGTQLINPGAPAEYGIGEKYLAAPAARFDLERESGPAAHHDAGGIKLVTFEF